MQRIFTTLCAVTMFVVTFAVSQAENDFVSQANSTVYLNCTLPQNGTVTWLQNGEKIENSNIVLEVTVDNERSGRYRCMVGGLVEDFTVYASPNVYWHKKEKNVIEDDPFQVECIGWGTLPLSVKWTFKGATVIADGDRVTLKNSTGSGQLLENATLRIQSVQYEDEGDYVCVVENEYGNATSTINIHVKDKLAALWPFLGICAEVVVLCTIIFIYEKRRNKRLEEAASREEADHLNAMDAKPNSDVRQRK